MIGTCCNDSTQQQPFAKTICSICYEDLKPIVEDLQAISICGHVFHELCIQQWFEYCKGKKKCPICKQSCSAANVSRLYFQSVGDSNDSNLSQKPQTRKLDPEELQVECRRFEGKVKGLNLTLESRENDLKNISHELCVCKEQLKNETTLKSEALEQIHKLNRLLNVKTQELNKSDVDLNKLQERNFHLAKEVALLKLLVNLDLKEDEIMKYALFGSETHTKGPVDVLTSMLVARNKDCKDNLSKLAKVTADFNASERKKEDLCKDLEKANKEVEKLKTRIRNKEIGIEIRENEVPRALKASNKTKTSRSAPNGVHPTFSDTCKPHNTINEPDFNPRNGKRLRETENIDESNNKDGLSSYILIDDDAPVSPDSVSQSTKSPTIVHNGVPLQKYADDDVAFVNESGQDYPLPNIRSEASLPGLNSQEARDICFSGGILGPDGTKRHLGKWCKKRQINNAFSLPTTQVSGDLIAVGADGRGGTIKVLKSTNLPSFAYKGPSFSTKNGKFGAKPNSMQSRRGLQIDHFFSKAGR